MIRSAARFLLRALRSLAQEPTQAHGDPDRIDFTQFAEGTARYRALGAKIGEKVRLLGAIDGVNPHLVEIGACSVIGKGSILLTHCPIKGAQPVSIGQFVYIGYGAIVMPGVTLGDGCIVGAGSVVTRSAPANSILAGNPARVLRMVTNQERARIRAIFEDDRMFGRACDPQRPASMR